MAKPPERIEPLGRQLVFTAKAMREAFEATLVGAGGSLGSWIVMSAIAEVHGMTQAALGVALERAELEHREEVRPPADPLPAVEHRTAAREHDRQRDHSEHGQQDQPEDRCEEKIERAQLDVDASAGRLCGEAAVPADEGVLELRRHHPRMVELRP